MSLGKLGSNGGEGYLGGGRMAENHGGIYAFMMKCMKVEGLDMDDAKEYIENIVFHIDPIEFYDSMIDFPVMGMEEIPDCFKDEVNQAVNQAISELITANNITDTSNLTLEMDIRVQVNVTNDETVYQFVIIVLDSEYKYDISKRIEVKDNDCLFEFKKYYTKKLEVLFFGDVKTIGGIRQW